MPKIVVEGPDGRKFAFPDTMPQSEINAFMRSKYGTKARNETVDQYLARVVREEDATKARAKDIDVEATAAGRAEGERAAERMGVDNPFLMAFAAPAIGLAQQSAARDVYNREGTVLADEAAGLSAINAAGFFVPGMVNKEFGARVEEGRRQQPLAAFAGDVAGGFGPGEIIGAGVAKAAQAVGPSMAALGRMFSGQKISPEMQSTLQQTAMGSIGGSAYGNFNDVNQDGVIDQKDVYAGAVAGGVGLPATVKGAQVAGDFMPAPRGAPRVAPDAMPAGGYFGRQSMRPPGSGPSAREIETRQQWATATPIVTQARTTAQTAQQAADAALQSKAPADIARAKDQKKALVGQLQEAQASRAGMDTPEDARLAETLASLAENTSDPVLLSTQISAAKTSLDRLLTDIGSPVEGNLIPVRTKTLTRTQAPRSAAKGPQDRASVTRYAAGQGDEIKPQGFGAGGPKIPERKYPLAPKSEWYGNANFEQTGGKIQQMTPDEFLSQVRPLEMDDVARDNIDDLKRHMQSGKTLDPLSIDAKGKEDGRHRAIAAKELGIESVPVLRWGTDDLPPVRPMGFGASTPNTPQQAARFETPGSPEYEAAVAKGLDMSTPARMARAKEMGFDTDTVLYHGTTGDISSFKRSKTGSVGPGIYLTDDAEDAAAFARPDRRPGEAVEGTNIMPLYIKRSDVLPMAPLSKDHAARLSKYLGRQINEGDPVPLIGLEKKGGSLAEGAEAAGFAGLEHPGRKGAKHYVIFDPANIRSVHAAFDPDKATSSTLLAAAPFAAVGGAGMTAERELGARMKEKKD